MKPFLIYILFASVMFMNGDVLAGDGSIAGLLKYPEPAGEKCVEPTDVMRRGHMDMIQHQRDETMRKGIRGITAKYSLKGCIDCHADYDDQGKAVPINGEGQFCQSCHDYAAVSIDCFSCHRTTPDGENKMRQSAKTPHNLPGAPVTALGADYE